MEHDTKKKYFSKIIDHDKFILFITLFIFKYRKQSQKKRLHAHKLCQHNVLL